MANTEKHALIQFLPHRLVAQTVAQFIGRVQGNQSTSHPQGPLGRLAEGYPGKRSRATHSLAIEVCANDDARMKAFCASKVAGEDFLGEIGLLGLYTRYYLATPEVLQELHAHGLISEQKMQAMRGFLDMPLDEKTIEAMHEQHLIEPGMKSQMKAQYMHKGRNPPGRSRS